MFGWLKKKKKEEIPEPCEHKWIVDKVCHRGPVKHPVYNYSNDFWYLIVSCEKEVKDANHLIIAEAANGYSVRILPDRVFDGICIECNEVNFSYTRAVKETEELIKSLTIKTHQAKDKLAKYRKMMEKV